MKSAIAATLPDEHFVIRVDGRVKSHHRRFLDTLREGLQLRDQFPQHDVKVQSMPAQGQQELLGTDAGTLSAGFDYRSLAPSQLAESLDMRFGRSALLRR
jgi:hypothetical protein